MGKQWKQWQTLFWGAPKSLWTVTAAMKLKNACSLEEKLWQAKQCIKKQRLYFANKGPSSQGYGFSSSRVWMWEWDHKEGPATKNWCFWIVVLEKTLESPLDFKEIKLVNPKGNQSWIFTGRTDAEAVLLWPLDERSQLILGKVEGKRRRGRQRMRWLDCITDSMDMNLCKLWETVAYMVAQVEKNPW